MKNNYGAGHDFNRKKRKLRRAVTPCPITLTIKLSDDDYERLEELKLYLSSLSLEIEGREIAWDNESMLIRQCIKMAKANMEYRKIELSQKQAEKQEVPVIVVEERKKMW